MILVLVCAFTLYAMTPGPSDRTARNLCGYYAACVLGGAVLAAAIMGVGAGPEDRVHM